eukprot:scaffold98_cov172-Amphora_coffeaeformis.AAC.10
MMCANPKYHHSLNVFQVHWFGASATGEVRKCKRHHKFPCANLATADPQTEFANDNNRSIASFPFLFSNTTMKDVQNSMPRTGLLHMATFSRPGPDAAPSDAARRIPAAAIIACIEEALRILDDDLEDDSAVTDLAKPLLDSTSHAMIIPRPGQYKCRSTSLLYFSRDKRSNHTNDSIHILS